MASKEVYKHNKVEVFKECGLKPHKNDYNTHHQYHRSDLDRHLLPKGFPIDDVNNLVPLPVETHQRLHEIIDSSKCFKNNISLRVYLSNMAFNEELDLIPERLYYSDPKSILRN